VSDFINEEDGCLVQHNEHGDIVHDAQKVIYPGASGDSWWDTQQLLAQVDTAINIFNATHPDCQALFIFNQSSAHASLGLTCHFQKYEQLPIEHQGGRHKGSCHLEDEDVGRAA